MKAKKPKPRGRPALAPAEKKRRNFTFRGTDVLHALLSDATAANGRSLSEEIEWRLGRSFLIEDIVERTAKAAVEATLAYVDQQRAKEDADRNRVRPFLDLLKSDRGDK
jgi:hypothetical protein